MSKLNKALRAFGIGILGLVATLIVAYGILGVISTHRLNAEISKIRAKGEPVTLAEIEGPGIPDSENAALVYERIFEEMSKPDVKEDIGILINTQIKPGSGKPVPWEQLRQILNRRQNIFAMLEEAVSRPKCRFSTYMDVNKSFPVYAKLRRLPQILRANTLVNAHNGNMDEAARSIELSFKISNGMSSDPLLITYLVQVAMNIITTHSLYDAARYGDFNEAQSKRLFDEIAGIDMDGTLKDALIGERVLSMTYMKRLLGWNGPPAQLARKAGWVAAPYINSEGIAHLALINKQVDNTDLTYKEAKDRGLLENPRLPSFTPLAKIMAPIYPRTHNSRCRSKAELANACVLLAAKTYKSRYGAYPQTLTELESRIGWKLPKDPYTGDALKYRLQGQGFIVYSLGPDLKDDGGQEKYSQKTETGDMALVF